MKLSDLSIKLPVFASMMSLALVLFSALGYQRLTVRELPDIDPPVIPEQAVAPTASGAFVWVVQGDKVTRREVELGVRTPGFVEVRRGIDVGDRVVVGGLERLSEGAAVRATEVQRRPQGAREK